MHHPKEQFRITSDANSSAGLNEFNDDHALTSRVGACRHVGMVDFSTRTNAGADRR